MNLGGGPASGHRAEVVTVSTRASSGVYRDRGGPAVVESLRGLGFDVGDPIVVADGEGVHDVLRAAVAAGVDLVITTGGTGISPTDATPEMTRRVIDREIPGIAEALRAAGARTVPTAILSCGAAGVAAQTLIVNLPGSVGAVRDGMAVLGPVITHAIDQLRGGDHHSGGSPSDAHEHERGCQVVRAVVTEDTISADEHARLVEHHAAGAVATFAGIVRDHDGGRAVERLEYVAHPSAQQVLAEIAARVGRGSGARALAVSHRIGALEIGDVALACAVSSAHRAEAFALCHALVDEVKAQSPIWKLQVFGDGTQEWVGCP